MIDPERWGPTLLAIVSFLICLQTCPSPTQGQVLFADGFESGDTCLWTKTVPASHLCVLTVVGELLRDVCAPLVPVGLSGKPPIGVEWDVEADGSVDMTSTAISRRPEDQRREAMVCWAPDRLGTVPVSVRVSNAYGTSESTVAFRIVDPTAFGACCLPDGSCTDIVASAACSDRFTPGAYCDTLECRPAPDPMWGAICPFGQCLFETGELVSFVTDNTQGPYRYAWLAIEGGGCHQFGPWMDKPVQSIEFQAPAAYRPCIEARDLAGRPFRVRTDRPIYVIQLD